MLTVNTCSSPFQISLLHSVVVSVAQRMSWRGLLRLPRCNMAGHLAHRSLGKAARERERIFMLPAAQHHPHQDISMSLAASADNSIKPAMSQESLIWLAFPLWARRGNRRWVCAAHGSAQQLANLLRVT